MRMQMSNLSSVVLDVRNKIEGVDSDYSEDLKEVAKKLIVDTADLVSLWKAIEKRSEPVDDLWVWGFLEAVEKAARLPCYHYKSKAERVELVSDINKLSRKLSLKLQSNDLDGHLFYNPEGMNEGFYIYEDFEENHQAEINKLAVKMIGLTTLLNEINGRSRRKVLEEPLAGKAGKNNRAIRFIRIMADRNRRFYGQPLNKVIMCATNALFETNYVESDITKRCT
jgi:hypothetical protein